MAQADGDGRAQGSALLNDADTIAAVSSGRPPAAIAIIRVSGPLALAIVTSLAGPMPQPRQASLRALRDRDGELLDRALVIVFPGPNSATGEDLVELHCHGGRAVVDAVELALHAHPGVRRAEPGEFTRRAVTNGRIDLTEAEGLADLLEAETETQRRAALAAAEGQVSRAIRGWLDRLATLSAMVEASIDYAEEEDGGAAESLITDVTTGQRALANDMAAVLAAPPVDRWRDGVRVVIAGPPNAGKSTLINQLGGRDAAIVSPIAGTTRDRIEVTVRRNGIAYVLIDTAGLHDASDDPIERAGMERSREALATADLVLWLGDDPPRDGVVQLHGKADLPERREAPPEAALTVSALDRASVERLWDLIENHAVGSVPTDTLLLHARVRSACCDAHDAIKSPLADVVVQAEQLRKARYGLAGALGLDATEVMLDALFSRFCVGK